MSKVRQCAMFNLEGKELCLTVVTRHIPDREQMRTSIRIMHFVIYSFILLCCYHNKCQVNRLKHRDRFTRKISMGESNIESAHQYHLHALLFYSVLFPCISKCCIIDWTEWFHRTFKQDWRASVLSD